MIEKKNEFFYIEYLDVDELNEADRALMNMAREATKNAYAPYSKFKVGAAGKFITGQFITGTNQENASYPVGICAERVLLCAASSLYPDLGIETIAISYHNLDGESNIPVSPCGICRQTLTEFEIRTHQPIRILLSGMVGKVIEIKSATHLLPLSFSGSDLLK